MPILEDFLKNYSNKSTLIMYRSAIFKFIEFVYEMKRTRVRLTNEERAKHEKFVDKYFSDERDTAKDLLSFVVSMNGATPPQTAKTYYSCVKEFVLYNGKELSHREIKTIKNKLPRGNARTEETDLDNTLINQITEHMDIKGKALVLMLASSGMRIGEALQLDLNDVDMSTTPTLIKIRGEYTKTGNQRQTFISKEAKTALDEWLKVRSSYIKSSLNRNKGLVKSGIGTAKSEDDNRLFPFSYSVAEQMWKNALKKSKNYHSDESTGRKTVRIHALRKFFRTHLAIGCPLDIVEALMGHEGYLTDAYRKYNTNQLGEIYLKYEHLLYISMPEDIQKLKSEFTDELNNTKDALCHNRTQVEGLITENAELNKEVQELKKSLESIAKFVKLPKDPDLIDEFTSDLEDVGLLGK